MRAAWRQGRAPGPRTQQPERPVAGPSGLASGEIPGWTVSHSDAAHQSQEGRLTSDLGRQIQLRDGHPLTSQRNSSPGGAPRIVRLVRSCRTSSLRSLLSHTPSFPPFHHQLSWAHCTGVGLLLGCAGGPLRAVCCCPGPAWIPGPGCSRQGPAGPLLGKGLLGFPARPLPTTPGVSPSGQGRGRQ